MRHLFHHFLEETAVLFWGFRLKSSETRHRAIEQLGRYNSARAVTRLAELLPNDPTDAVAKALGETGHPSAIPHLEEFLRKGGNSINEVWAACVAMDKLGKSAHHALAKALTDWRVPSRGQFDAAIALGRLRTADAARALVSWYFSFEPRRVADTGGSEQLHEALRKALVACGPNTLVAVAEKLTEKLTLQLKLWQQMDKIGLDGDSNLRDAVFESLKNSVKTTDEIPTDLYHDIEEIVDESYLGPLLTRLDYLGFSRKSYENTNCTSSSEICWIIRLLGRIRNERVSSLLKTEVLNKTGWAYPCFASLARIDTVAAAECLHTLKRPRVPYASDSAEENVARGFASLAQHAAPEHRHLLAKLGEELVYPQLETSSRSNGRLIAQSMRDAGWEPTTDKQRAICALLLGDAKSIELMGDHAADGLLWALSLEACDYSNPATEFKTRALKLLSRIRDPRTIGAVIAWYLKLRWSGVVAESTQQEMVQAVHQYFVTVLPAISGQRELLRLLIELKDIDVVIFLPGPRDLDLTNDERKSLEQKVGVIRFQDIRDEAFQRLRDGVGSWT